MTTPAVDFTPSMLAARATNIMVIAHRIAYAQLDSDLMIVQTSSNFFMIVDPPNTEIIGFPIASVLWEFVGAEKMLLDILHGRSPAYHLKQVNRGGDKERQVYLDFQVQPLNKRQLDQGLLVLVEDRTENGRLQQSVVQDRNELRLLQHQIIRINEDLRHLDQLKSLFLSISAHDLRTPLTSINGYAALILKKMQAEIEPSIIKYLKIIYSESSRMGNLINNFINLDHIEQGTLPFQPIECDLREIVQNVAKAMQFDINNHQVTLDIDMPDTSVQLWADKGQLFHILYNLLNNALKRTPQNGRISIKAGKENKEVWLQVQNDGSGIMKERLNNLFDLYYHHTKMTTRNRIEGSELDLYVVKMLVEAHQGDVKVSSKLGKGSLFTVTLPVR